MHKKTNHLHGKKNASGIIHGIIFAVINHYVK